MPKKLKLPALLLTELEKSATQAALAAGSVIQFYFGKRFKIGSKGALGLVTSADLEAEKAALKILRKNHKNFSILAEESGLTDGHRKDGRWIIDPLDGTTNFVHGFPMFCVSIAAEWEGELAVGVIYHPILQDLYVAVKGQGATVNGEPISVSKTKRLNDSLLTTGFTYQKEAWLDKEMDAFERLSRTARAIRRPGSAAMDLAYTARGVFDGFWERRLAPWDTAAGALLVMEAGGRVTDFSGQPFKVESKEILATNKNLFPSLQNLVAPRFDQF